MFLPEFCIRRPVFASVLNWAVVLLGLVAAANITVRQYPNIDEPVISVETHYRGANVSTIESDITSPLEDELAGIEGVNYIQSTSRDEYSQITVRFHLDRNVDGAASDVRDRVGRARAKLPEDADESIVAKSEADAEPIIWLALTTEHHTPLEVTDVADTRVKGFLETLPGVADIVIAGERRYAMRIWLSPAKLAAYNLTPLDVENALRAQNLEMPGGRIEGAMREYTVRTISSLETPLQFQNIIIKKTGQDIVRLKEVAKVELGAADERVIARFNGKSAVGIGIVKQSTANPLSVSKAVRQALPKIMKALPQGMELKVAYDSAIFVKESINAVIHTLIEAVVLVVLVIFFFLRSFRATLIPLITIPISLIGAVAIMYMLGYSINTLTLLAMVLAIGLVVDDAIVVLENIYRHIEEGEKPIPAAIKGSKEIAFAVIAMTLTLAAVFAPISFTPGRTGQLFVEFAMTLAGAVIVSGFAALTLSPMMCSKLLKHEHNTSRASIAIENFLNGVTASYKNYIKSSLTRPKRTVIGFLAVVAVAGGLFLILPSELTPVEDQGVLVGVAIAPEGSTIDYTDKYSKDVEKIFAAVPEVESYFSAVGFPYVTQSLFFNMLKPWDERDRKQQLITNTLFKPLISVPGVMAFPINPPSLGQSAISKPLEVVIQTNDTYEALNDVVKQVVDEISKNPNIVNIETDLKLNKPQIQIELNRDKIADLGLRVASVGGTIETLVGGKQVTRFKRGNEQYDVYLQVAKQGRTELDDLGNIYVRSSNNKTVRLSNVISAKETVGAKELNHFNKLRAVTITANLTGGYSLGTALEVVQNAVDKVSAIPVQMDYRGNTREYIESAGGIAQAFSLAVIFIFLVLAAQFESYVSPFVIMLTVPLAMAGALGLLWLTDSTLNVYSQIGLITLVGLITKHGIMIVEFANQLRDGGMSADEAIVESASLRLRPIMMTSAAMILGALPLAYAGGAGAETRQQLGYVIVGGMTLGSILTVTMLPVFYRLMVKHKKS